MGACEDQDEHSMRDQFELNFFGTLNVIQASLPYFRRRGQGRYLILTETVGALGVPGLGRMPFTLARGSAVSTRGAALMRR